MGQQIQLSSQQIVYVHAPQLITSGSALSKDTTKHAYVKHVHLSQVQILFNFHMLKTSCTSAAHKTGSSQKKGLTMLWAGPAQPARPKSLTFIDKAWPQPLTFIYRAQASQAPQPLTFISKALAIPTSLLLANPQFYWPDPLLLSARPLSSICQARPRHARGPSGPRKPLGLQHSMKSKQ